MNTSLAHLPAIRQQQLRMITRIIREAVCPEKVILFGMYSHTGDPGFFRGQYLADLLGTYDLLVITRPGVHRSDHELQDIIENRCRGTVPVTVFIHDIDYINNRLVEGHYFFYMVVREATLLYDAGLTPLAAPSAPDLLQVRQTAQQDFERWKRQAGAFFRSALFNLEQQEYKIVAFLLHQAAEHIYSGILLAFTGYKPSTHNLDKLRRYTNRFSIELALLFPRDNNEEDRLFRLLLQGYVDARYKDTYHISEKEAGLLVDRIDKLLSVAERVCRNRFISLERMASSA